MSAFVFDGPERETVSGRYRNVLIGEARYFLGVERGRPVRIPYKPCGENRGHKWNGFVRNSEGRTLWAGEVSKSQGYRGLLKCAGLIEAGGR